MTEEKALDIVEKVISKMYEKVHLLEKEIQIKTLEEVIEDIQGMNPEYIIEFLREQIDIIKYGI